MTILPFKLSIAKSLGICLISLLGCSNLLASPPTKHKHQNLDVEDLFKAQGVKGSLLIYKPDQQTYYEYNAKDLDRASSPASTFKIPNSMIALQEGVATDAQQTFTWDSKLRSRPEENQDHTLATAYRDSIVWVYQDIARKVGKTKYKQYLASINYGNQDISGAIDPDPFWIGNSLQINPRQQMDFLVKLYNRQLEFSPRVYDIMQDIMLDQSVSNPNLQIRAKTGWSPLKVYTKQDPYDSGWWIGYAESNNKLSYFVIRLKQKHSAKNAKFLAARKTIVLEALQRLDVAQ